MIEGREPTVSFGVKRGGVGWPALAAAALGALWIAPPASPAAERNASIVRSASGTIEYRRMSTGKVNGSERWTMIVRPDGSRILETRNRIDPAGLSRLVVLTVAPDFRPRSLFADFWREGRWIGTGLFTVEGTQLAAQISSPHGRVTQQVDVPERFGFIPHPTASNAWQLGLYDRARGGAQDVVLYDVRTEARTPGSLLGPLSRASIRLVGTEQVRTPAGTFSTEHYRAGSPEVGGETDFFVYGPDLILVRFVWPAGDAEYVLTALETVD